MRPVLNSYGRSKVIFKEASMLAISAQRQSAHLPLQSISAYRPNLFAQDNGVHGESTAPALMRTWLG